MMVVVAYVPDLMDRSRLSAVGGAVGGAAVEFVSSPAGLRDLAASADLVIVDLERPGVLEILPEILPDVKARTIGFGSHVDRALLAAARAAGCSEVLPRSAFFGRLSSLLAGPGR